MQNATQDVFLCGRGPSGSSTKVELPKNFFESDVIVVVGVAKTDLFSCAVVRRLKHEFTWVGRGLFAISF
jgi:hypothetical protein